MNYKSFINLSVFLIIFFTVIGLSAEGDKNQKGSSLSKTTGSPTSTFFNINNISTWLFNNLDSDISKTGNSGFIFPKGSNKAAVFETGFIWGATVNGERRVGGSTYNQGVLPGRIDENGNREDTALDHVRIFRVRTDWATGNVGAEMADEGVSDAEVRAQYEKDWNEWPAQYGAPYEDVDANGSYDAAVDVPGFPGADQTIWFVANDLDPATTRGLYGSDPMGVEIQATIWGYAKQGALGNTMFRKYKIINKSVDTFDSMYVALWSDVDLGGAGDDYSGCDIDLSLAYTYNGDADDAQYGKEVPALGFDFFQGPIVPGEATDVAIFDNKERPGFKNLPMSAHFFFINSDAVYSDPTLGDYVNGTLQMHNLFRGKISTTGEDFVDPTTGEKTKFTLSGDPITGSGWVDGLLHPPGDRRQGLVAGPFTMAVGDTQEVVVAEIAAGAFENVDRLGAIGLLKFYDQEAQSAYDNFFKIPPSPEAPQVAISQLDNEIVLVWDQDDTNLANMEDYNTLGYKFQGYVVYQFPSQFASIQDAKIVATYDINDGVGKVIGDGFDPIGGVVLPQVKKFGSDSDIKRYISLKSDLFNGGLPLNNGSKYYYAVSSYAVAEDMVNTVPVELESPILVQEVIPQSADPGMVLPEETFNSGLEVTHSSGSANAAVTVKVVDQNALTGDDYEVFFDEQHYYMDVDGVWKKTNYADSVGRSLDKLGDVSPSTVNGIAFTSPIVGTRDLKFTVNIVAPDFNYAEGVKLTFPPGVQINSADGNGLASLIDDATNSVIFGNEVFDSTGLTGAGPFAGGELVTVNINTVDLPLSVNYVIYDDGWATLFCADTANAATCDAYGITDAVVVNAEGVTTISEEAFAFHTEQHWNMRNVSQGIDVLEDQLVLKGVNTYTGVNEGFTASKVVDGLQVDIEDGGYAAPINFLSASLESPTGLSSFTTSFGATEEKIAISNYTVFGGVISSWAFDNFGAGTTDLDQLQQDYELRFTGVYDAGTSINGQTVFQIVEGGQMATVFRMISAAALATNPLNPNQGTAEPFLVRIPFEVWNVDDPENPYQVNLTFRDRLRDGTEDPYYVWNMSDREYAIIVNSPYNETQIIQMDTGPDEFNTLATWVLVFTGTNYNPGDVVSISYANPIQFGKDVYSFTAPAVVYDATLAKEDVKNINVFPNPYYGTHSEEINKYQRFVTFNHLPPQATMRVFNLAGQLVKTIEKDDATQFAKWDLTNENSLPAASGMYVVYIDMPELGETKILKVAIIQETQILDRF